MRYLKMILPAAMLVPAAFLITGGLMAPKPAFSTPAYAKDTKKACTYCHVKTGPAADMKKDPNLTDTGKCFQKGNHKLDGCPVPPEKK